MVSSEPIPVHVIDFEGNALEGIFEYGLISLEGHRIAAATGRFCRVDRPTTLLFRQEKNRRQDLEGTRPFQSDFDLFHGRRRTGIFAAHNATCEDYLLRKTWATPGFVPDFLKSGRPVATWGPWIDTAVLYRKLEPDRPSYRLANLIAAEGLQNRMTQMSEEFCPPARRKFHCALFDALAAGLLLLSLMNRHGLDPQTALWLSLPQKKFQSSSQIPLL